MSFRTVSRVHHCCFRRCQLQIINSSRLGSISPLKLSLFKSPKWVPLTFLSTLQDLEAKFILQLFSSPVSYSVINHLKYRGQHGFIVKYVEKQNPELRKKKGEMIFLRSICSFQRGRWVSTLGLRRPSSVPPTTLVQSQRFQSETLSTAYRDLAYCLLKPHRQLTNNR